jgi:predicted SAM-dependent methyltransferase
MSLGTQVRSIVGQTRTYRRLRRAYDVRKLREQIRAAQPLKVLIGSGGTFFDGWITTDKHILDITNPRDWQQLFKPESIDRLLSEHVLEHLSEAECRIALTECYRYLKPGALFRVAVPDGYRRDPDYVAEVAPPNDGHQVLFTVDTFVPLLESIGFKVTPLEYFDAQENFHAIEWDESLGFIKRSIRFDDQVAFKRGDMFYTSLIVDAKKV